MNEGARIVAAFRKWGFAEIDVPSDLNRRMLPLARSFYAKPLSERLSVGAFRTKGVLGYYPSEGEMQQRAEEGQPEVPLFNGPRARGYSSFDYIDNPTVVAASPLFGANLWPDDTVFSAEASAVYRLATDFMRLVSSGVLRHLCKGLDGVCQFPEQVFDGACCSMMRLLRYDATDSARESKAHSDYEFITLVKADSTGLEVRATSGAWTLAPCSPTGAVLLPGNLFEVATNRRIQSPLHRVRLGASPRTAVIFFQGVGLDCRMEYADGPEKVLTTFGKHLCGRLVRGAAHLRSEVADWEARLGTRIPEKNPFGRLNDAC